MGLFRSNRKSNGGNTQQQQKQQQQQSGVVNSVESFDSISKQDDGGRSVVVTDNNTLQDVSAAASQPSRRGNRLFFRGKSSRKGKTTKTTTKTTTTTTPAILTTVATTTATTSTSTETTARDDKDSSSNNNKNNNNNNKTNNINTNTIINRQLLSLDTLNVIPDTTEEAAFEVMTPESRAFMLEQREIIRKKLFEEEDDDDDDDDDASDNDQNSGYKNKNNNNKNNNAEYDDDDEIHNITSDDDSLRAMSPPPPPPPPLPQQEDEEIIMMQSAATAYALSQEVLPNGIIRDTSILIPNGTTLTAGQQQQQQQQQYGKHSTNYVVDDDDDDHNNHDDNHDERDPMDESLLELHNLALPSTRGITSIPISVDISYTDSEIGSLGGWSNKKNKEKQLSPSPITTRATTNNNNNNNNDDDDVVPTDAAIVRDQDGNPYELQMEKKQQPRNRLPVSVDLSYTESELESVKTSRLPHTPPNAFQQLQQTIVNAIFLPSPTTKTIPTPTTTTTIIGPVRSSPNNTSGMSSSMPDDERAFDQNFQERVNSPIPDDERMEYNKDEMQEHNWNHPSTTDAASGGAGEKGMNAATTTTSTTNTLSSGIPSSTLGFEPAISERHGDSFLLPNSNSRVEITKDVDPALFEQTAIIAKTTTTTTTTTPVTITVNGTEDKNGVDDEENNKNPLNTSTETNNNHNNVTTEYEEFGGGHSSVNGNHNPGDFARHMLKAMNCSDENNFSCGKEDFTKIQESGQQVIKVIYEKAAAGSPSSIFRGLNQGAGDRNADENKKEDIKKKPSFFYTSDEDFASRFARRITNNGFVLLHLQPPGSPGNASEDWSGRTVTMTIEKGIVPDNKGKNKDFSSGSTVLSSISNTSNGKHGPSARQIIRHPVLQWMTVAGGLSTDVSTTNIDLMDIQAVTVSDMDDNDDDADSSETPATQNNEDLCFFTITTEGGDVHMFEAPSLEERDRIVKGLKTIVARLAYHLISGNPTSTSELYTNESSREAKLKSGGNEKNTKHSNEPMVISALAGENMSVFEGEGDLPSLPNPRETMNRVAHVFLDM